MNEHEFKGAVRHVKGRAETAVSGVTGDLAGQAEGLVDQIAGGVQHAYGKAVDEAEELIERGREVAHDAAHAGRRYAKDARDRAEDWRDSGTEIAREARSTGAAYAGRAVKYADNNRLVTVLGVAAAGFLVGWLARPSGGDDGEYRRRHRS